MKSVRSLACSLLSASFALLVGCSGALDGHGVLEQSMPVLCAKQKSCSPELYALAYGTASECETTGQERAEAQYGSKLDAQSVCTQQELDECLDAFTAEACPADGSLPDVPCHC